MVRTLALAALVTLFGAVSSQAQYRDSAPPDEQGSAQYDTQAPYSGYDEELLGPPNDQRYNDDQQYGDDSRGYSHPDINVGMFASLGNDGRWFMTANFGWVWRPYAAADFRPYSAGRWVWTSYGWTWVSYEPFGWATYHYGYWDCDAQLGWVWVPGYDWSACRVQWAYYDNYVCWAPMTPPGYACPRPFTTAGFNIWFTIGANHFCDPYPARYCVTSYRNVYTPRVAYKSPDRYYVQHYTHAPVRQSTVAFKNTTFARGGNFNGSRSQTFAKSKSFTRDSQQPYVRNSRPYSQPQTRDGRTYKNAQPNPFVQGRGMQPQARDARTYNQGSQRSYKNAQPNPLVEARGMQPRQKDVGHSNNRAPQMERQVAQPQQVAHGKGGHGGGHEF
ncbi:MAG TPA: DUF6600 domain-containing protein, partial [Candidatus Krumholzibacteria bacterium]|nr:DUF6600 domain-containing protein [Candidatus Krumholzibacteria bacterium]